MPYFGVLPEVTCLYFRWSHSRASIFYTCFVHIYIFGLSLKLRLVFINLSGFKVCGGLSKLFFALFNLSLNYFIIVWQWYYLIKILFLNTLVLPSKSKTKSGSYSYSGAFLNFGNQSYSYSGAFTNFEIPDFDPKWPQIAPSDPKKLYLVQSWNVSYPKLSEI